VAQCVNCGKSGAFMEVSTTGLCMSCLEMAVASAVETLERLHSSKDERKRFCAELDRREEDDLVRELFSNAKTSAFDIWDISVHLSDGQYGRMLRASDVSVIGYDENAEIATVKSATGGNYKTTLQSCECYDYSEHLKPCKHMYRLAFDLNIIDAALLPVSFKRDKRRNVYKDFAEIGNMPFSGNTFVFTGVFEKITREEASDAIRKYGGEVSSSISKKTSWLVSGYEPGDKLLKAEEFGIPVLTEERFIQLLNSVI
jgi:NAD-dependent DNA ligase